MPDTAPEEPLPDPLIEAIVEAMLLHAAPGGAVDYPRAAAAFAQLLAEMIGPQLPQVRNAMMHEFSANLAKAVNLASLRASIIKPGDAPPC